MSVSVAIQFPARRGSDGIRWYRPVREAGMSADQWGWTSNPRMAHPDYRTHYDAECNGLHPAGLCGGDCSGCVEPGEGG